MFLVQTARICSPCSGPVQCTVQPSKYDMKGFNFCKSCKFIEELITLQFETVCYLSPQDSEVHSLFANSVLNNGHGLMCVTVTSSLLLLCFIGRPQPCINAYARIMFVIPTYTTSDKNKLKARQRVNQSALRHRHGRQK